MSDIQDKDELELHDLGFSARMKNGKLEITDMQGRVVEILNGLSSLRGWIANYKMGMGQEGKKLWVTSGYGIGSKAPFVNLAMPHGELVQMSPEEAEDLARNLLACAAASRCDAFVIEWSQDKLNIGMDKAAYLLDDFRKWMKEHNA